MLAGVHTSRCSCYGWLCAQRGCRKSQCGGLLVEGCLSDRLELISRLYEVADNWPSALCNSADAGLICGYTEHCTSAVRSAASCTGSRSCNTAHSCVCLLLGHSCCNYLLMAVCNAWCTAAKSRCSCGSGEATCESVAMSSPCVMLKMLPCSLSSGNSCGCSPPTSSGTCVGHGRGSEQQQGMWFVISIANRLLSHSVFLHAALYQHITTPCNHRMLSPG